MKPLHENTLLIVDDTPENIEILVELLDGYNLKAAINGQEALETAWEESAPDLILLDIMMPEMDGYHTCQRLRADERTKDVPVIFLTAKTQKEDIYKAFEVGGQDYVTKPFDARELLERVKTQLELKSQRETLRNMNHVLEEKVRERTALLDKANQDLMVLDEAKNKFLMMISHELRTPLNGIAGAAYLLNNMLGSDSELGEFLEMLTLSVDRLEKFSASALLITELTSKRKRETTPVDLQEVISECQIKLQIEADKKGVSFSNDLGIKMAIVPGNKELITYALRSVLENAVTYSQSEAEVIINMISTEGSMRIEVTNTGNGFSEIALTNLYKTFGLGQEHYDNHLGLSLKATKLIMEAHEGEILIESKAGNCAKVSLIFPVGI